MEYLEFSKNGQWSLHKVSPVREPRDADKPGNRPYRSYDRATAEGRLHEDRGQRGTLHDFGFGSRPKPPRSVDPRVTTKVPHRVDSRYVALNPGKGTSGV